MKVKVQYLMVQHFFHPLIEDGLKPAECIVTVNHITELNTMFSSIQDIDIIEP